MEIKTKFNIGDKFYMISPPESKNGYLYIIYQIITCNILGNNKLCDGVYIPEHIQLNSKKSITYYFLNVQNPKSATIELVEENVEKLILEKKIFTNLADFQHALDEMTQYMVNEYENIEKELNKYKLKTVLHGGENGMEDQKN